MLEILRDSIWTFFGTLAATAAIAVTIAIYFGQRQRKRLFVETVARVPLLANRVKGVDGLQITFQGEPLSDAAVLLVLITNAGNTPILASDYESPLSFEFTEGSAVLAADVLLSQPEGIPLNISISGRRAILSPQLMNPTDTVTCRFLLKNTDGKFETKGRVAGVKRIERRRQTSVLPPVLTFVSFVLVVSAFILSPNPKSSTFADVRLEEIPYIGVMLLGSFTLLLGMATDFCARLRKLRAQQFNVGYERG
jgi:hypothetical protein